MKHVQFLKNLGQLNFSGQLIRTDPAGQQWMFYLAQGLIMYGGGGGHAVRRWYRHLAVHCPQKAMHRLAWYADLAKVDAVTLRLGWEYALLNLWVLRQDITPEQAAKMLQSLIIEVLFDISQATDGLNQSVTDQIKQDHALSTRLPLVRIEEVTAKARVRWQLWQNAGLMQYSPNAAPVIKQAENLQRYQSAQAYQNLANLLNGQRTLYDVATQMRREVVEVTTSLLPFIRLGWIELQSIPDLPSPLGRQRSSEPSPPPALPASAPAAKKALIACVDDSFLVRHTLEKLLTSAGYEFLGIDDPLRAIGILLARKPDLIFLDLMMPNANGHEICEQLRKISCFRQTPIVILTGSDGFANRLRSNFVGASDFLSKPLDAEAVLTVIRNRLEPQASLSGVTDH